MYNRGNIIAGLVIFAGLVSFPVYYNMGKEASIPEPKIDTPVIQQLDKKECVESKSFMRANHMQLLNDWRDSVAREGKREIITLGGKVFEKSLQNGCMKCHSNKKEFCDKCHSYANVSPYCWDCHIAPEENKT